MKFIGRLRSAELKKLTVRFNGRSPVSDFIKRKKTFKCRLAFLYFGKL